MTTPETPRLILASGSQYRRDLLARLGLNFDVQAADIDETPQAGEDPNALAKRLAATKADRVAQRNPGSIVIGSDQTAALADRLLGKPGTLERAREQLLASSGKTVSFHTAVSVTNDSRNISLSHCDLTTVHFRKIDVELIDRYLAVENCLDCAGSFKSEGLGVVLFERVENQDPTALIGLPMIWLSHALRDLGFRVP